MQRVIVILIVLLLRAYCTQVRRSPSLCADTCKPPCLSNVERTFLCQPGRLCFDPCCNLLCEQPIHDYIAMLPEILNLSHAHALQREWRVRAAVKQAAADL